MASPWEMDRARVGWWVIAFVLGAGVAYLLYSFIGTFVFGIFIYYATRPVYRRLENRIRPPSLAAAVAIVALALPAILLLAYTLAVGLQELTRFVETRGLYASQFEVILKPYVDISSVVSDPASILEQPNTIVVIRRTLGEAGAYATFFGNAALHLFVMILLAFYLLRDDHRLADWFERRFADREGVMVTYAVNVDRDFSHIFFGNLLNALLTAIIGAISYGLLSLVTPPGMRLPYPTLLGLLSGIASLVPVVGIKLVYVPVAAYLGYLSIGQPVLLWFPILFVVVSFFVVDVIPDLVLRPYVSGRGLHLGMVMLAYVFGPLLFGWYGIFLGPMLLVLLVHFTALVLPELLAGTPIEPDQVGDSILTGEPGTLDSAAGTEDRPGAADSASATEKRSGTSDVTPAADERPAGADSNSAPEEGPSREGEPNQTSDDGSSPSGPKDDSGADS